MLPISVVSAPQVLNCDTAAPKSVRNTTSRPPTTELRARATSIRVKRHYDDKQLVHSAAIYARVCAETRKELDALRTPSLSPSSSSTTLSSVSISSTLATLDSSQEVQQWHPNDFVKSLLEFLEAAERPAPIVAPTSRPIANLFAPTNMYSSIARANRPYSLKPPPALRRKTTTKSPLGSSDQRMFPELRARLHNLCNEIEDITATITSLVVPASSSSPPPTTPTNMPMSAENLPLPGDLFVLGQALGLSQSNKSFDFTPASAGSSSSCGKLFAGAPRQSRSAQRLSQPSNMPSRAANTTLSPSLFSHIVTTSEQIVSPTAPRTQPAEVPIPPFPPSAPAELHRGPFLSSAASRSSLPALGSRTSQPLGAGFSRPSKLNSPRAEQPFPVTTGTNYRALRPTALAVSSRAQIRKYSRPFNPETISERAAIGLSKVSVSQPERTSAPSPSHHTFLHTSGPPCLTARPLVNITPDQLLAALDIQLSPNDLGVLLSFQSTIDLLPWTTSTIESANPWSTALEVSNVPRPVKFAHALLLQLPRFATKLQSVIPVIASEELARVRVSATTGRKRPRLLLNIAGAERGDIVMRERALLMCPRRMLLGHLHSLDIVLGETFSAHREPLKTLLLRVGGMAASAANGKAPAHKAFPIVSALRTCGLAVDSVELGESFVALFARISLAQHSCDNVNCVFEWDR